MPQHGRCDGTGRVRVCVVVGTRPEAIKLAPVIREIQRQEDRFDLSVVATSQHRELLATACADFGIRPHVDLGLTAANKGLGAFAAHALTALTEHFQTSGPDLVVVQGDTSTVVAAALAAFYLGIPVAHVEAGLRSGDLKQPFPEEGNRRLASSVVSFHFAPTEGARENLLREGIAPEDVYVTGNTVVDALQAMTPRAHFEEAALSAVGWDTRKVILATVHRRENLGGNLRAVCAALRQLALRQEGAEILVPVHPNPEVRRTLYCELAGAPRISLVSPLAYGDLLEVLRRCHFVVTDSGGLQEEAPSFGKPVLILRETTERPEVLESGFGRLVGSECSAIVRAAEELLRDPEAYRAMSSGRNPFGDGRAAERIVGILAARFGVAGEPRGACAT